MTFRVADNDLLVLDMYKDGKKLLTTYLSAMIHGFVEQANALSTLKHELTKGQLKEVFTQSLLRHFLPEYLITP